MGKEERDPLVAAYPSSPKQEQQQEQQQDIRVSVRTGVPLDRTVRAYLDSSDPRLNEEAMYYVRRVIALLVMQYSVLLFIVSPFCLVETFQEAVKPLSALLNAAAYLGVVAAIILALTDDAHNWQRGSVALCLLTFCVAVGIGVKCTMVPWANYVLVAIGQATTNFAILLAVVQFDRRMLHWLNYKTAGLIAFVVASVWMMVLVEDKAPWKTAAAVAFGGWLHAMNVLLGMRKIFQHRSPDDVVRSALFILGPNIPDFVMSYLRRTCGRATRHAQEAAEENESDGQQPNNYGGIGNTNLV